MDDIFARLQAALAETYAIERPLGEGGMAYVFLARDVKHDRQVAIKVLKPDLAASMGSKERFLREIQVTARLQHPNVLALYDSGQADGMVYYVMPFVEGESLHDYIVREKQLSLEEAVQIAREVAEALAYAHSFGLVHRDIKPDNVMMSRGHAVVADFGISRAMSEAGAERITQTGMAVGTPAYMSPEQAAGDPDVDGRTDIYALGCMLYEMLIGQIPFTGPTPQAIMARHTMDAVTPPSIMRPNIPEALEDVVIHALEKVPADRYRTADEMVQDLVAIERGQPTSRSTQTSGVARRSQATRGSRAYQRPPTRRRWPLMAGAAGVVLVAAVGAWYLLGRGGPAPANTSGLDPRDIAVMYFDDLSPDSSLAPAAAGFTEELITQLARVPGLQVVSRNGVAPFRGTNAPLDSVGHALQVGTIVVGSVERAGNEVRVSTRLVDGASGADLRARRSFQMPAGNLLAARDSLVEVVSDFLRQRIGQEVRVRERQAGTQSVEAWSLLQRAIGARRDAQATRSRQERLALLARADSLAQAAEAADEHWADARLERGWVAYQRGAMEDGRAAVPYLDQAIAAADSVVAANPNEARALELRGTARFRMYTLNVTPDPRAWQRLLTDAQSDLQSATNMDPSLASAFLTLSRLDYFVDDVAGAVIQAQRAYDADAYLEQLDDTIDRIFWGLIDQEQFGSADKWCSRGSARFPQDTRFIACHLFLMVTPGAVANVDSAWHLRDRLDSLSAPAFVRAQGGILLGGVLARANMADSARHVWQRNRNQLITPGVDPGEDLAALEAYTRTLAGDMDEAIDLLKRAVAANPDHDFASAASRSWWWRELRNYPRWREIGG